MIFNILDNTTELYMTKYIIGEIFSSGRAKMYKNPSDQTVFGLIFGIEKFPPHIPQHNRSSILLKPKRLRTKLAICYYIFVGSLNQSS